MSIKETSGLFAHDTDSSVNESYWEDNDFYFLEPDDTIPDGAFLPTQNNKKLIVPRLQRMDDYIKLHYSQSITRKVCQWIDYGLIDVYDGDDPQADPDSIHFGKMEFWRIGRTAFAAVIELSIMIEVTEDSQRVGVANNYYAVISYYLDDTTSYSDRAFELLDEKPDTLNWWPLNEFLIPRLRKNDVERYAEDLLYRYIPEANGDQKKNCANTLADKLGLKVERYRLVNYQRTRSILFFNRSTITAEKYDSTTSTWQRFTVNVPANTIIINNAVVRAENPSIDIYHECIHYEWHYLFYRLQKMHNNDLKRIQKDYKIHFDTKGEKDPLSWLEWQARQGAMSLWMPRSFMDKALEGLHDVASQETNNGARYQLLASSIAEVFNIPKYRVRARLINMGHIGARGALNYCSGRYIEPFAFNRDKGSGNYTFFIPPKACAELYCTNQEYRDLIQTGNFVYVDGHVCINDPKYVICGTSGPFMSSWAKAHVDMCCLRFIEIYEQDDELAYVFGRLNSDETYNRHYLTFPGCNNEKKTAQERKEELDAYVRSLRPLDFPEMLVKLMSDSNVTVEDMEDYTGISDSTIKRLRREHREVYSIDQVIGIIICLHLSPLVSMQLLERAFISFDNPARMIYSMIIHLHFMDTLKDVQSKLKEYGHPKLKLRYGDEEEAIAE